MAAVAAACAGEPLSPDELLPKARRRRPRRSWKKTTTTS